MAIITGTSASETLTGTDDNDTIYGNGGTDILLGAGGQDWIYAGDGPDRLEGGDGDDRLFGYDGDDTILGDAGADYLEGGDGRDVLNGGAGDDTIVISLDSAFDTLTGGAGADLFQYDLNNSATNTIVAADAITDFSAAEGDRVYLGVSNGRIFGSGDYLIWYGAITMPNFSLTAGAPLPDAPEPGFISVSTWTSGGSTYLIVDRNSNGVLNDGDFVLEFRGASSLSPDIFTSGTLTASIGTAGADVWSGTAGRDVYFGFAGADVGNGLGGDDQLNGDDGDDTLNGGDGDDYLYGGMGGDTLDGGAGADTLYAGLNSYVDNDSTNSNNTLRGGDGNDIIYSGNGKDVLEGGAGNDLLTVLTVLVPAGDVFMGGEGNDELRTANATLDGGAGDDTLWIVSGNTITGGTGADVFKGMNYVYPKWTMYGVSAITDFSAAEGDRIDIGELSSFPQGNPVFRGAVTGANFGPTVGQTYSTDDFGQAFVQVWTWAGAGATYLFVDLDRSGTVSADDMVVKFTNNAIITADSFLPGYFKGTQGGAGPDTFIGGAGDDTYYGAGGNDLIRGGAGADFLAGNAGADQIFGELGADRLLGGDGDDVIEGGDGNDLIYGGLGSDTLIGGDGDDYISATEDGVSGIRPDDVDMLYGGLGNDQLSGGTSSRGEAHGGEGDDYVSGFGLLFGDAGQDTLFANTGAVAHGGDGDDRLASGDNGATLYGDAGGDTFAGGFGADVIYAEIGDAGVSGGGGDDQIHLAPLRAGETARLTYVGGFEGNDTFIIDAPLGNVPDLTLSGEYDFDTLDLSRATTAVTVDLSLATAQETGMGRFKIMFMDAVIAGNFGSVLKGDDGPNRLTGGAAVDTLSGGKGGDTLTGGGGNDLLDGGEGLDAAAYAGPASAYSWTRSSDGTWTVKDLRAGAADGQDTLKSIETLRFSDRTISLTQVASETLLRVQDGTAVSSLESRIANGALTLDGAIAELVNKADATTSVASMSYQFFTAKVPTAIGVDYLISPTGPNTTNLNSAYYAKFDTVNRYINFAVNLGKNGEAKDSFAADYGSLSLFEATRKAYGAIFGGTPTDAKVHQLLDTRIDYLAYYGADGAEGIGTKAAMVGFLLAAAATENLGVIARSNDAWLIDLADGTAPYAVNILDPANGYYKADFIYGG